MSLTQISNQSLRDGSVSPEKLSQISPFVFSTAISASDYLGLSSKYFSLSGGTISGNVGINIAPDSNALLVNGALKVVGNAEFSGVVLGSDLGNYNNVITEPLSTRTLSLQDCNQYIRFTNISGCAVTVAPQSAVSWVQGSTIYFRRVTGAGVLSFVSNGVVINNSTISSITAGQTFAIKRVGSDNWDFI